MRKLPWFVLPAVLGLLWYPVTYIILFVWKQVNPEMFAPKPVPYGDAIGAGIISYAISLVVVVVVSFLISKTTRLKSTLLTFGVVVITLLLLGLV